MSFKIGKIATITRPVKVNVPDGEDFRVETVKVGMKIFMNSEYQRLRTALVEGGSKDVELDFMKQHAITSIEGPQFDDGTALTIDEALDVPYLRVAIDTELQMVASGVKRKN